jgi:DNA-binding LytR/AlgR family response regulator
MNSPASSAPEGDAAPRVRAIIADDERLMREQLRARLAESWPELEIVAEARNGIEAVDLVAQHHPEVVFLDIRMPGLTGVDAARRIAQLPGPGAKRVANENANANADAGPDADADAAAADDLDDDDADDDWSLPEIVFITAYDQYAVEAFEQGVADYVLKPAERDRLSVTVERIKKRLALRGTPDEPPAPHLQALLHKLAARLNPGAQPPQLKWIQATVGQAIQMIPVEDVLFFISDEKYTRVQTATIEALIRKPIKELVDELDPEAFWQIHRSTLVNTRAISGVTRDLRGRQIVAIKGHGEKLEVSRSYTHLFKGM